MKYLLLAAAAFLTFGVSGVVHAQSGDEGTIAASRPVGESALSKMSAEERRAYWAALPEAERERIRAKRAAVQKAKNWNNLSPDEKARRMNRDQDYAGVVPPSDTTYVQPLTRAEKRQFERAQKESTARGKAQWEAMTPDQKRAFLKDNAGSIDAATRALRQGR